MGKRAMEKEKPEAKKRAEPKKKGKAEIQATAEAELGEINDEDYQKHAVQKQCVSACRYMGSKATPDEIEAKRKALQHYLEGGPDIKADALTNYTRDKSMKWTAGWVRQIDETNSTTKEQMRGWMTMS